LALFGAAEFPQREVGRRALVAEVDAVAGAQARDVEPGQVAVAFQARGVEVDAVGKAVGSPGARSRR
jgi:transcription antitermination factor NusA-like protein